MSTTRLRKAFRYPDDSGDDEQGREELDEEGLLCVFHRINYILTEICRTRRCN